MVLTRKAALCFLHDYRSGKLKLAVHDRTRSGKM